MNARFRNGWLTSVVLLTVSIAGTSRGTTLTEAIVTVGDRLVAKQVKYGLNAGIWPLSVGYTGPIASGVAAAYTKVCDEDYRASAELAGGYILDEGVLEDVGNYYGDATYALIQLSENSDDPNDNIWRQVLEDFYYNISHNSGGTAAYITQYSACDISEAVIFIAHHVIASHYVNAADADVWRQGLIDWLATLHDETYFPVMAMVAATWALASTGPMDETLIDPSGTGEGYWNLHKLSDLPALVLSHQVPSGQLYAGGFYARFDHTDDNGVIPFRAGYTEDTVFGLLAMVACRSASPGLDYDSAITAARDALMGAIAADGSVWEHTSGTGWVLYAYAGELLLALAASSPRGDLDVNGRVNFNDLALMLDHYMAGDCALCTHDNADLNRDGAVNGLDVEILADNWLSF